MNKNKHSKQTNFEKSPNRNERKKQRRQAEKFGAKLPHSKVEEGVNNGNAKSVAKEGRCAKFLSRFGTDVYRVETPVYSRLLNELSRVAKFKNIQQKDGFLQFEASRKQREEIIALLDNLCYTHNIVSTKGVLNGLFSALKRAGLVIGMFCAVGAFLVYPHFVFTVEYNGDKDKNVQDALSQFGIEQGALLWNLDEEAVEKHLLSLEGISFASVEKVGTRVCVRVVHQLPAHTGVDTLGNTIATKDGVVTRIVVYSGTAQVQVGDRVEKGQVLIGDYYLKGEDKIPAEAKGEVYVERQVTFERFFPDETYVVTGEKTVKTVVGLFGHSKAPKSPYQYSTTKLATTRNDFLIPYTVYNWTFYEIAKTQNTLTEDEMKSIGFGQVIDKHQFERLIDKDVSISKTTGGYVVKIILTVEEKQ